jgi:hypothetical protein
MAQDVFLAYSRSDGTEAKALALALRRWGYSVWYDMDILPGADWVSEIVAQYRKSVCLIALLSESSMKSLHVRTYVQFGIGRGNLVAVAVQDRLDESAVSDIMGNASVLDISEWRLTRDPKQLDVFLRAVSDVVGRMPVWVEQASLSVFRASRLRITGDKRGGHDIFVSYKREDSDAIKEYIQIFKDFGFSVWWDQLISAGENWGFAIDQALMKSRCVVVFWSPRSVASQEVYSEAEYGISKNAYFPILLETCSIPPRMTRAQYVDVTRGRPLGSEGFHLLIDQLKKKVEVAPAQQ